MTRMIEPVRTLSALFRSPASAWPKIASDSTFSRTEMVRSAALFSLIPALSRAAGLALRGSPNPYETISPLGIASSAFATWLLFILVPVVMAILLFRLSPIFGGQCNREGSYLTVFYATLPVWAAGLLLLPFVHFDALALIVGLAGFCYLLSHGSRAVLSVPEDKAIGLVLVIATIWLICYFVLYILLDTFMAMRG